MKIMNISFILFLIIFNRPASVSAQDKHDLLWKISGNNLQHPSYLYGTIHLLCQEELHLSDSVQKSIAETSETILEINLNDPTVPEKIQRGMILENGSRLSQYVSEADYNLMKTFFRDSLQLNLNTLDHIKPMFLMTLMVPRIMNCATVSPEKKINDLAARDHRIIQGLETVEEQVDYINRISPTEQAKMLLESIRNYDSTRIQYHQMVKLYKAEEIDSLFNYIDDRNSEFAGLTSTLVTERNESWASKIDQIIRKRASFIAVGAGHLGGEKGLISLLSARGYKLTPVD